MAEKKEKRYVSDNAQLMTEWNWEKNNELNLIPETLTLGSNKKVWWKCEQGHEWQAIINDRNRGKGCPYCSGRYAIKGKNDLETVNPTLAKEWNYEKNVNYKPENFTAKSGQKVWWKCSKGHEWQATINNRNRGNGCPVCNSERNTSFPEYAVVYYLKKYCLDTVHSYNGNGYELDVYIPSKKIAIEYDGYYWHKNKVKKDLEKNLKCKNDGIKLYRIREGLPSLNDSSIDYIVQKNQKNFSNILKEILGEIIATEIDVDIERDTISICALREYIEKENSLLLSNPEIAQEWNYEKNGDLKPENFAANSNKKVWWKCSKGHEWKATIINRNTGSGCPYCAGKKVLTGYNDLQTVNPILAREWNCEKNKGLTASDVMSNSGKKVWWKCSKDHEWKATIDSRNNGNGCPYCAGQKVIKGYNDLQTVNPILAREWNCEKNKGLTASDVMPNSGKKVWWKCSKGHEWKATISHRNNGKGCPYCSGRYAVKGKNDLETVNPILAKEWNYEKNNDLTPMDVMPNSNKKVWWKCSKRHEWQAKISDRNKGRGCPYCAGQKVIKGYNDLETVNSTLAKEWNYKKNNGITPADVMPNSDKKVWWKCNKGHEWQAVIGHRNKGSGCPYCSGRYAVKGKNDLETVNPTLAKEWNYEKNVNSKPENFTPKSGQKVWWRCSKGHEWQATIDSRSRGRGCPYCSGKKVIKGYNDLQTINPTLAKDWNYEKNVELMPEDVTSNSGKIVWWKCSKGHEWQSKIQIRNNGAGCPICAKEKTN